MLTLPIVTWRPAQPYAFVRFTVRMDQIQTPALDGFPVVFACLTSQHIQPVGAAFYNYRRIDMTDTLDVEAGVPVEGPGTDEGSVRFGTLPAGRFADLTWTGHPDQLMTVTGMLIGWAREANLEFDMVERIDGDHFACRLEIYETDPDDEPDMNQWVTHLAFKLRD
jgi:effector-binding domain-containing protein